MIVTHDLDRLRRRGVRRCGWRSAAPPPTRRGPLRSTRTIGRLPGDPRKDLRLELRTGVGAGDGPVRGHDLRAVPLRPRPEPARGGPRGRGALGDAAVRRHPRHQPPVRRRARGGRVRRDPAGADRPHLPAPAKALALLVYLVALEAIACRSSPCSSSTRLWQRTAPAGGGDAAGGHRDLAVLGALLASIAVHTRARDLLLPILLLPLAVPADDRGGRRPLRKLLSGCPWKPAEWRNGWQSGPL